MAQLLLVPADGGLVPILRGALFLALVAGLGLMWSTRSAVVDAYAGTGPDATDIRFGGVELDYELSPLGPSPYLVAPPPAADAGSDVPVLAFAADEPTGIPDEPPVIDITGGTGRIAGVVTGPEGAVAGATVRIERHTSHGSGTVDVTADRGGRWALNHVLGGRFRIRAWHPEGFATTASEVFFLAEHESRSINLPVEPFDAEPLLTFTDAGDIYVGLSGTVAVSVTVAAIDDAGLLALSGVPGAVVSLEASSGAVVVPDTVTADSDGVARFQVHCLRPGSVTAVATNGTTEMVFVLPDCLPQPAPTPPPTTAAAPTTSTTAGGRTPTTAPGSTAATAPTSGGGGTSGTSSTSGTSGTSLPGDRP